MQLEKLRYLQLWMRYLFEFLWTHSWDVGTFVPHNFKFLTFISNISVLAEFNLWATFGVLVHYFQIILHFLYVCQSVSWLTSLLKLNKYRDISSSGWDIFLIFWGDIPGMLVHLLQMILNFMYVCQYVYLLTSLSKVDKGISPVLDEISF